ncbi:MAG: aldo/keto reductase, partial [Myxococcales bacterium]
MACAQKGRCQRNNRQAAVTGSGASNATVSGASGHSAAIAIPVFLNQRQAAWTASLKSDLANASIAAEAYASANNGSYAGITATTTSGVLTTNLPSFKATPGNTFTVTVANAAGYTFTFIKRMGIETFDLYYAHVDDRNTPLAETMQAFDRLVKAGKVRFVGASNYLAWRLEEAHWTSQVNGWADFCCIQQHYTYLKLRPGMSLGAQQFGNDDLLDYCRNRDMTLLAYGALQRGAYTRPDRSLGKVFGGDDNQGRLATLRAIA